MYHTKKVKGITSMDTKKTELSADLSALSPLQLLDRFNEPEELINSQGGKHYGY